MTLDKKFYAFILFNTIISFLVPFSKVGNYIQTALYNFIFMLIIYFLLDCIKSHKIQSFLKNTLLIFCMIVGFIDLFCIFNFNTPISTKLMHILLTTQKNEIKNFLAFYFQANNIILFLIYIALCILFFAIKKDFIVKLNKKFVVGFLILSILVLSIISIKDYLFRPSDRFHRLEKIAKLINVVNVFYSLGININEANNYRNYAINLQKYLANPNEYIVKNDADIRNIVLIIGESASRNFMHIYGYDLDNTPVLDNAQKDNNLFIFKNVISPEAHTEDVFETILDFSDYENRKIPWYKQMNLLDILKMAGYQSAWFSNQDPSSFASVANTFASRADYSFWTQIKKDGTDHDENLIQLYNKHKNLLDANKKLIVFHLLGSHLKYYSRFPANYKKFKPQDINTKNLHTQTQNDLQIVADYVNSLYYTDHILGEIFELFKNTDTIIFYFSDHAQDIFESKNHAGHLCDNYGVEIPFMIYVTDTFKQKHPKKVDLIQSALNKPFMTDDFIQSFLPLIGIKTKDNIASKNIFSPHFDAKRKRIYCDNMEYDKQ